MSKAKMPKEEKSSFSHFFRQDAKLILDVFKDEKESQDKVDLLANDKLLIPRLQTAAPIAEEALKDHWRRLRSFFRNGDNAVGLPEGVIPAILAPFYTRSLIVKDFPVWVAGEKTSSDDCVSLNDLLQQSISLLAKEGEAPSILARNVDRIISLANDLLRDHGPQLIKDTLSQVLDQLVDILQVKGAEGQVLINDLEDLKKMLPGQGVLIPFSSNTAFELLDAAITKTSIQSRKSIKQEIQQYSSKLKDLLQIEEGKSTAGQDSERLHDALSFAESMVKFDELSTLVPDEGSEMMDESRKNRIRSIVQDLEMGEKLLSRQAVVFIDQSLEIDGDLKWEQIFTNAEVHMLPDQTRSGEINDLFEEKIAPFETFFKAKRIAELEWENRYQPEVHDEYFGHFDWQNFSHDELKQSAYFILIISDIHLFGSDFAGLSEILTNNLPVKIIAIKKDDFSNRGSGNSKMQSLHSRVELGALMMSYKNIYVAQSSSIAPQSLFRQFEEGLSAFAPAFIHLLDAKSGPAGDAYLHASAAMESRDFPGFTFKGLLGTPWGSRFKINHNPQPSLAWTQHSLEMIDQHGQKRLLDVPFTFADWATLNTAYHRYFLPVGAASQTENLVPLVEYLDNNEEQNIGKIPFIWMVDQANILHKVAVSWPVVIATQERLDFWRFLQENSGINNYHVAHALEEARIAMSEKYDHEVDQLKREHQEDINNIKREEASRVMENLASFLLELDIHSPGQRKPILTQVPIEKDQAFTEVAPVTSPEDKLASQPPVGEEVLTIDPYIDTALCTTCHECINKNKAMFRYNSDKMATIADPRAGTFRQLVEAAEVCPVAIIHPGTPLNPHEPDLENLIERAAKFN